MESGNNSNMTTIGGVTFGGGLPPEPNKAPAPQPAQNTPAPSVDQNGTITPVSTLPNTPPTSNTDFENAPLPNALNVPLVSPTHFDDMNTVNPTVNTPGAPNPQMNGQLPQPQPIHKQSTPEKAVKKASAMSVVFGILAAIFLLLAVGGLVYGFSVANDLAITKTNLNTANNIVKAVEETTGVTIKTAEDVPVYKATTGYIYLSNWNIKIKMPSDMAHLSYILNEKDYHPSICFNGVQDGVQYFPDFADVAKNPGRMGCLTRIKTAEGSNDSKTGLSYGTLVFTDDNDYNYFYTDATYYSPTSDAANRNLEQTAIQIIKVMLTTNVSKYE